MTIGCIGQGFVGKNIADNFEDRGYAVVRYSLEEEYVMNKSQLATCEVVFIAVPTPTTPQGFDISIVAEALSLVADGAVAVIKSTLLPGSTKKLQDANHKKIVLFSPEFLCEKTAAYDVAHPLMNVIGLSYDTAGHRRAAVSVQALLPTCEHNFIVPAEAAETYKYAHNLNGYFRVILANLLYDMGTEVGVQWADVKSMMDNDVMMSPYYNNPIHKGGRGAGGNCFIKDMAAFRSHYEELCADDFLGVQALRALEKKNIKLLRNSQKCEDILQAVYGDKPLE